VSNPQQLHSLQKNRQESKTANRLNKNDDSSKPSRVKTTTRQNKNDDASKQKRRIVKTKTRESQNKNE